MQKFQLPLVAFVVFVAGAGLLGTRSIADVLPATRPFEVRVALFQNGYAIPKSKDFESLMTAGQTEFLIGVEVLIPAGRLVELNAVLPSLTDDQGRQVTTDMSPKSPAIWNRKFNHIGGDPNTVAADGRETFFSFWPNPAIKSGTAQLHLSGDFTVKIGLETKQIDCGEVRLTAGEKFKIGEAMWSITEIGQADPKKGIAATIRPDNATSDLDSLTFQDSNGRAMSVDVRQQASSTSGASGVDLSFPPGVDRFRLRATLWSKTSQATRHVELPFGIGLGAANDSAAPVPETVPAGIDIPPTPDCVSILPLPLAARFRSLPWDSTEWPPDFDWRGISISVEFGVSSGSIIDVAETGSTIALICDDRSTDLGNSMANDHGARSWVGGQVAINDSRTLAAFEVRVPRLPAPDARAVHVRGFVNVLMASHQSEITVERVDLKSGATFQVGRIKYTIGETKLEADGRKKQIELKPDRHTPEVAALTLLDDVGQKFDSDAATTHFDVSHGGNGVPIFCWTEVVPAGVDHVRVSAHVWDDPHLVSIPIDVRVGLTDPVSTGGV